MNACNTRGIQTIRSVMGTAAMVAALAAPAIAAPGREAEGDPAWRFAFADPEDDQDKAAPRPSFWESIEVAGFVDGYYGWAFNESTLQLRNFDVNHSSFTLSYAEIGIIKTVDDTGRAGFRVDFGAGDTADMVHAFEPGGTNYLKYVQQAYVSYYTPIGKGLTIDFGKFVTPHGGEVIESKDNNNYSRGLLFALAIPYYHAGARLSYAATDKVSVVGYIVNGWNSVRDINSSKTVAIGLTTKPAVKLSVNGTYMVGKEQPDDAGGGVRNLFDVVALYAATEKLGLLANFDYGQDAVAGSRVNWYGLAIGAKYQATDRWAFSPRYEILEDGEGFTTGLAQTVQEITLTGEYKAPGGLLARFEFRTDFSDEDYFLKKNGRFVSSQPSVAIGLIYAFSSKQ